METQPTLKSKVAYESYCKDEENEISHGRIWACRPELEAKCHVRLILAAAVLYTLFGLTLKPLDQFTSNF